MPYNIERIYKNTSVKGVFFFDANIWINILTTGEKSSTQMAYCRFFENVCTNPSASIAVSPLLISEVINAYLRQIALPMYNEINNTTITTGRRFKSEYRLTEHYTTHLGIVCDEFDLRSLSFVYLTDLQLQASECLKYPKLDYNDFIYYKQCLEEGYKIVTDDIDFFVEDVQILTLNKKLLSKNHEELTKGLRK